jgi:hypothetical protein
LRSAYLEVKIQNTNKKAFDDYRDFKKEMEEEFDKAVPRKPRKAKPKKAQT